MEPLSVEQQQSIEVLIDDMSVTTAAMRSLVKQPGWIHCHWVFRMYAPRITWHVSSHAALDAATRSHGWNRCTGFPFANTASTSWLLWPTRSNRPSRRLHSLLIPRAPARSLRSGGAKRLIVPRTRTVIGSRAFSIAAPTVWSALPDNVNADNIQKTFEDSSVWLLLNTGPFIACPWATLHPLSRRYRNHFCIVFVS